MMAWKLKTSKFYRSGWGKLLLSFVILFAIFIVVVDILEQWGTLKPLLAKYIR